MKGKPDISKDREPKELSKVSSSMKQTKMEQEPSERNNYSGTHARMSALRQTDSQERLTLRQPYRKEPFVGRLSASRELQRNFRHNHTAISMGCSPHKVVPP